MTPTEFKATRALDSTRAVRALACAVALTTAGTVLAQAGPATTGRISAAADGRMAMAATLPAVRSPGPATEGPELRAQLAPRRFTTLAAEIGARVQRLTVAEGGAIRAGQLLVSLDCSLQQAQLERAEATLGAADKQLATQRRLVELNATGRQELDQAEAEVAKTRAELNQIRVQLGKCAIAAPFSGRISEQKVREQQFVQPGQALLEVLDDSVLEVEFIMPSRWMAQVRQGSAVRIAVDETGREYPARVQRMGARVDPVSQSIKVVASIDGRPAELVAGMSGRVIVHRQP